MLWSTVDGDATATTHAHVVGASAAPGASETLGRAGSVRARHKCGHHPTRASGHVHVLAGRSRLYAP